MKSVNLKRKKAVANILQQLRPLTKSMSVVIFLQKSFKNKVKYGIIKA